MHIIFPLQLRILLIFQLCACCISELAQPPSDDSGGSSTTPSTIVSPTVSIILFVIVGVIVCLGLHFAALRGHLGACCLGISLNAGGGGVGGPSRPPAGLSREAIDAFPTYLYEYVNQVNGQQVDRELECAVCLNEFEHHQALRLLPECSHTFHPQCIDPWLLSQATCPVCRSTILEPSSSTSDGSEDDHNHVIIMDPLPSVESLIHEDLQHGSPRQPANLHSIGHSPSVMDGCEPSSQL